MHREISHADSQLQDESPAGLYAVAVFLGLLLAADLWPALVDWLGPWGAGLPRWPNEIWGIRLSLAAAVIGGARTLYGSLEALLQGRVGADLAVAIAVLAAILLREPLVAAEVLVIGLVGEILEDWTFRRTRSALAGLARLTPRRCWRLLPDGSEERVLVSDLRVGDRVQVRPGAKVPADGVILEGSSSLDTRVISGESIPRDVTAGDEALAGSINGTGVLVLEARRVAEHTVAGQVAELTTRALADKAPLERQADSLARWFLPVVLAMTAVTFIGAMAGHAWSGRSQGLPYSWTDLFRLAAYPSLAVLVVACPCSLLLATPAAIIAALGRLAGTGILVKSGAALERLARVDTFCFDKTGTVTAGKPELASLASLRADLTEVDLLRLAATVEAGSEHPLALAIRRAARERGIGDGSGQPGTASPGGGMRAATAEGLIRAGNARWLASEGVSLGEATAASSRVEERGETPVIISLGDAAVGVLGLRDAPRPEAAGVIGLLRRLDISGIELLSGDRPAVAGRVAAELGIADESSRGGLLPADKSARVGQLRAAGARVAMLGDGINDAPALAAADVGIAVCPAGSGNDLAAEAGDIVLMGPPLENLPLLVSLARATEATIRQNITVFAFGVNIAGVVITAWLWPFIAPSGWKLQSPLAAVIYHQLGSLLVLANSMRLLGFNRPAPRWLGGLAASAGRLASLLDRLAPGEIVHAVEHHWRKVVAGALGLALLAWVWTGFHVLMPWQEGRVLRFGRVLPAPLGPGWHLRWPAPVERVVVVSPGRLNTLELGFRSGGKGTVAVGRSWSATHGSDGILRFPDEAVMISGDGYLVEVQASVRFSMSAEEPFASTFEAGDAAKGLRMASEAALREIIGAHPFAELLTTGRAALEAEALRLIAGRAADAAPGLSVTAVALHDLHPPQEVVGAYHEVTRAMEGRSQKVLQAKAQGLRRVGEQVARDLQSVAAADVEKTERTTAAAARAVAFTLRVAARKGAEALSDFRLLWDAVSQALAGRDKIVIDAENIRGRRNLWLLPQEWFRQPAPPRTSRVEPEGREP
ncbi:MAG: heavy metal translocating P-type ATPase [Planctomycetes bacterium]|nr:heavy metal translocating P-type ATPase [Planctomycetota bacterium]